MTMRPEDIKNRTFAYALRGYDKNEVRSFLFQVSESSRELHERLSATEARLVDAVAEREAVTEYDEAVSIEVSPEPDTPDSSVAFGDEATLGFDAPETQTFEPTPFVVDSFDVDTPDAPDVAVTDETVPTADAFVEAPTESLAAAEQSIADRYGAIGDRIAELLRNADESADEILTSARNDSAATRAAADAEAAEIRTDAEAQASQLLAEAQAIRSEADAYRDEVMAELANARLEQEAALLEARTAAEADVETYRVDSIAEITALRSDAFVEIDELRSGANNEVAELRSLAQTEAEAMRESVLADAAASIADDEADAARLREEAEADRAAARSELDDVRSEVNTLLEQARTQSEFIKQEADEIIRTKVRANFEQAQARIDVLRNTEVASRERIVLAQTELASALTRLDSEPMPELDPTDSPAVIQEAVARHDELVAPAETFEVEAGVIDTGLADGPGLADNIDLANDADAAIEAEVIDTQAFETDGFEADEAETDDFYVDGGATPNELGEESLSNYFGPGVEDESKTTGDILAGSFDAPVVDDSVADDSVADDSVVDGGAVDSGWPTTEYTEVESVEFESVSAAVPVADPVEVDEGPDAGEVADTFGDFGVTEHVVVESAEYGDLPVRGADSDLPVRGADADLPVRGQTEPEAYTESFGAASLAEALPEDDAPELGGVAQEDALARLVREAMQEAVDSARKND